MSDEGQRARKTTGDFDQTLIDQPYLSELDEAIAWRDRFMAWQTDRMRGNACTEEQIEAMARKALDMPYAFWIQAMPRRPGDLAESCTPHQLPPLLNPFSPPCADSAPPGLNPPTDFVPIACLGLFGPSLPS
jgi:hypothetical protein